MSFLCRLSASVVEFLDPESQYIKFIESRRVEFDEAYTSKPKQYKTLLSRQIEVASFEKLATLLENKPNK